jgi:NADPH:quinone reductase-like Zn-dependent oxidoreductase
VQEAAPAGYAAVLDPNGADTLRHSYNALGPMGRLIVYGFSSMIPVGRGRPSYAKLVSKYLKTPRFNPIEMTGDNKSVMAFNLSYLFEHAELLHEAIGQMLELFAVGRLRPLGFECFSLSEAGRAQHTLESGQTTGKLVLLVK